MIANEFTRGSIGNNGSVLLRLIALGVRFKLGDFPLNIGVDISAQRIRVLV